MFYLTSGKRFMTRYRGKTIYNISNRESSLRASVGGFSLFFETLSELSDKIKEYDVQYLRIEEISNENTRSIILNLKNCVEFIEIDCNGDLLDVSYLSECKKLKELIVSGYHKLSELWDMSKNPVLEKVEIYYTDTLVTLNGIKSESLKEFSYAAFSYRFYEKCDSILNADLSVFKDTPALESLSLTLPLKPRSPVELCNLALLKNLKNIKISKYAFSFKEFAWLKSKIPEVSGLECIQEIKKDRYKGDICYAIIGREFDSWIADNSGEITESYIRKYQNLVEDFKNN